MSARLGEESFHGVPLFSARSGRVIQSKRGRTLDFWFRPKRFETEGRYKRLGALVLKRYVPTGGDWALRWLRRHQVELRWIEGRHIDSLWSFEGRTRLTETIHLITFVGFSALAAKRFVGGSLSAFGLSFAIVLNAVLGLWPVVLQRYNRLRAYRAIESALRLQSKMGCRRPPPHRPPAGVLY